MSHLLLIHSYPKCVIDVGLSVENNCIKIQKSTKNILGNRAMNIGSNLKTGGVSKEMSEKEAIRKKQEAEKKAKEEEKKKEEALGPNFPKAWDLNYFREDTQKIFKKLSSDKLDWDFFDFPIYPHEESYFTSNF